MDLPPVLTTWGDRGPCLVDLLILYNDSALITDFLVVFFLSV